MQSSLFPNAAYSNAAVPHEIEPELLRRTPRASRFRSQTRTWRLVMLNALAGAILLGIWLASNDVRELHALQKTGIVRIGEVNDKTERHGKNTTYTLYYQYETDEGPVNGSFTVPSDRYYETSIGDPVTVTYLPADPEHHRMGRVDDERIADQQTKWTWGIFLSALGLGGVFALIEADYRKQLYLIRDGLPVVAHITKKRIVRGKSTTFYLHYQFALTPAMATNKQVSVSSSVYERFNENDALTVLYDPRNLNRNLPYLMTTAAEIT